MGRVELSLLITYIYRYPETAFVVVLRIILVSPSVAHPPAVRLPIMMATTILRKCDNPPYKLGLSSSSISLLSSSPWFLFGAEL